MSMMQIRTLARNVRQWAEKNATKYEAYEDDLCGMCGIATTKLSHELLKKGIKHKLILVDATESTGEEHCFIYVNNYIVDVTATQFGKDTKVCIVHKDDVTDEWYWQLRSSKKRKVLKFTKPIDLVSTQKEQRWSESQIYQGKLKKHY